MTETNTAIDPDRPNFTPIDPKRPATATAAATGSAADERPLRAQPRAGAGARRSVATATGAVRGSVARRRVEVAEKTGERGRRDDWRTGQLPSLAALGGRIAEGPTVTQRVPYTDDVIEESADWHGAQIFAWRFLMVVALVVSAPAYALLFITQRPLRIGWALVVVAVVLVLRAIGTATGTGVVEGPVG